MATDNSPKGLRKSITALEGEFHKLLRDAPWKNHARAVRQQRDPDEERGHGDREPGTVILDGRSPQHQPERNDCKTEVSVWRFWTWEWRHWKRLVACVGVASGIVYAYLTYRQWQAAIHSNEIATDAIYRSHRPWVYIPDSQALATISPLTFSQDQTQANTMISYSIKNAGSSPSLNTWVYTELDIDRWDTLFKKTQRKDFCDRKFTSSLKNPIGFLIAPGEAKAFDNIPVKTNVPFPSGESVGAIIQMCVIYRDEFDAFHGTGYIWQYATTGTPGKVQFQPNGTTEGHWQYFAVNSVAY